MISFYGQADSLMRLKVKALHEQAIQVLPEIANYRIFITLNPRMRSCGGRAKVRGEYGYIDLNYRLFVDNPDQLKQTYLHELAHVVQRKRHGYDKRVKSHGIEWQRIMRDFGLNPDRCHSMDVSAYKSKRKRFLYKCGCQTHALSSIRHNKMLRGQARYSCTQCGHKLERA